MELARLRSENEMLLHRIIDKPVDEPVTEPKQYKPIQTMGLPWRARRELLEKEDRDKAQKLRNAAIPDSVEKLENEIIGETK